jgi:hypothetical protein
MLALENKLLPPFRSLGVGGGGDVLQEIPCRMSYSKKDYKQKQKERYSYETETWNIKQ